MRQKMRLFHSLEKSFCGSEKKVAKKKKFFVDKKQILVVEKMSRSWLQKVFAAKKIFLR